MKKLIELDAALSAIGEVPTYNDGMVFEALSHAQRDVELLPTVDAVPVVHGRWKWLSSTYDRIPCEKRYWCSKCHHETITHDSEPWEKFCPNCGAKMDGKEDDQNG